MESSHVGVLGEGLPAASESACPHLRSVLGGQLYPVQCYCVLGGSPGGFMIPSIEEFREFCSGSRYAVCPWFGDAQDNLPAKHERGAQ
jgi:hypothetical protein